MAHNPIIFMTANFVIWTLLWTLGCDSAYLLPALWLHKSLYSVGWPKPLSLQDLSLEMLFLLLFLPLFYSSYNFGAREYWETLQWIPWILKSSFIHSLATNQLPLVVRINHPASWITAIKSPKCPGGSSSSNVLEPWLFFLVEEVLLWRLGWPNPQIKVMGKKQKL